MPACSRGSCPCGKKADDDCNADDTARKTSPGARGDRAVADAIQAYRLDPINPGIRGLLKQLKPDYEPPQTSLLQLLK